jgi:hypothetical protein
MKTFAPDDGSYASKHVLFYVKSLYMIKIVVHIAFLFVIYFMTEQDNIY